jgi:hypothetical protein
VLQGLTTKPAIQRTLYKPFLFKTGSRLRRFQNWTENYVGFTPVLFFGRGIFQYNYGIVPYRKAITIVVGKPIRFEIVNK